MALATTADVKIRLGITGTTHDALIDALIADATAEMEVYCGRRFESADVTDERGDGLGQSFIIVQRFPITSIASISIRSGVGSYTPLASSEYEIRGDGSAGIVDRVDVGATFQHPYVMGSFGGAKGLRPINSYRITYTGGYLAGTHDTELAALRSIVCDIVAAQNPTQASTREERAVYQSESLGYQNWTYRPVSEVMSQFHGRLEPFRRFGL